MKYLTNDFVKDWDADSEWIVRTPGFFAKENLFYIQEAGFFRCSERYYTQQKNIASFVIILTLAGKGSLSHQNKDYALPQNSVVFLDSMEHHIHRTYPGQKNWDILWIQFNGKNARAYYNLYKSAGQAVIPLAEESPVRGLLGKILQLNKKESSGIDLQTSRYIVDLLTELLFAAGAIRPPGAQMPDYLIETIHELETHFSEDISLNSLSEMVSVSKYHLIKEFKHHIGRTPWEYLLGVRINQAKQLLSNSGKSVSEIAEMVGFRSVSHFVNTFKNRESSTPLQYRQKKWQAGRIRHSGIRSASGHYIDRHDRSGKRKTLTDD